MGFYKDKIRGDWIYRFEFRGKNYGGRGFKTKGDAMIARGERLKELKKAPVSSKTGTGFFEIVTEYLDESKRRHAKKVYETKVHVFKLFMKTLPDKNTPIDQITAEQINEHLKTRPSNNNFNIHRKELRALFNFAIKKKHLAFNPVADIEKMPHTRARKHIPTEQQVLQLIAAAEPELERPLFLTILHTLGRVDEVLRLTWDDVSFEKRTVTLWTRKRKGGSYEADPMPMNQDLYDVLFTMFKKRTQTKWVFLNPREDDRFLRRPKMMRALCRRAFDPGCKNINGYKGPIFGFHTLRHFMASYMADQGKWSTKTLQRLLRHKEVRTTEIYLHALGDGLREAAEGVEGKFSVSPAVKGDEKAVKNAKND